MLAGDRQRFSAGHEHTHARGGFDHVSGDVSRGTEEMFTVVH